MRELNLASIDLNLLPALDALLRRRHVTRAAADVGLSQPAMSRSLSRLRATLGDDLLVRGSSGLVLTARAQALAPRLAAVLEGARGLYRPPAFDPATLQRTLRIASADSQSVTLVPAVMARVRREAPGLYVQIEPYSPDLMRRFDEGSLDLAFATAAAPLPRGAASFPVAVDRLALVMRRDHPGARRKWTLDDYARHDHAVVSIFGDHMSEIDAKLAQVGLTRRIAYSSPHFVATLAAVGATDMVTTLSRTLAARFADPFALALNDPPFEDITLQLTLIASAARASDPAIAWFSAVAREAASEIVRDAKIDRGVVRSSGAPRGGARSSTSSRAANRRP